MEMLKKYWYVLVAIIVLFLFTRKKKTTRRRRNSRRVPRYNMMRRMRNRYRSYSQSRMTRRRRK